MPHSEALAPIQKRGIGGQLPRAEKAKIAAALGTGMSVGEAAEFCSVSRNRIHGLIKDPEFQELVYAAEDAAVQAILEETTVATRRTMKKLQTRAAEVLEDALESEDARVRLQAAGMVLRGGGAMQSESVNVRVGLENVIGNESPAAGD